MNLAWPVGNHPTQQANANMSASLATPAKLPRLCRLEGDNLRAATNKDHQVTKEDKITDKTTIKEMKNKTTKNLNTDANKATVLTVKSNAAIVSNAQTTLTQYQETAPRFAVRCARVAQYARSLKINIYTHSSSRRIHSTTP